MYNDRLKSLRKAQKITQAKLADALKINRTTYTNYELGKTEPSIRMLISLAHTLNTTVDHLIGFSDNTYDVEEGTLREFALVAQERATYSALKNPDKMDKLNDDEQILILKYRTLPKEKKNDVFNLIDSEIDKARNK